MSKHYSTDNECILTGGLWALIMALIIGGLSLVFADFWPTAIVIFVVALLIGLIIAFFICKTRTVGRGGVDMRAVDLARAEMGLATPAEAAVDDGAAKAAAAKAAQAKADAEAKATAAEAKAEADAAKAKAEVDAKVATAKAEANAVKAKADADVKAAKAKAKADKAAKAKAEAEAAAVEHDHDGEVGEGEAKPELLTEARGGQPDDLKQIKGVGPKLEKDLNAAGVYHFDQIANWTKEEVFWADNHLLDGFKGRVSRDNWVSQAKELAK